MFGSVLSDHDVSPALHPVDDPGRKGALPTRTRGGVAGGVWVRPSYGDGFDFFGLVQSFQLSLFSPFFRRFFFHFFLLILSLQLPLFLMSQLPLCLCFYWHLS